MKTNVFRKSISHQHAGQCDSKCYNLKHEHQTLARLDHPNIVKCDLSFYKNASRCCLKLEKAGCDYLQYLSESYSANGTVNLSVVSNLQKDLLSAVQYLHNIRSLAHNDIKPENCLLFLQKTSSGRPYLRLKLADFEFSQKTNQEFTLDQLQQQWKFRNTKQMSPELIKLVHEAIPSSPIVESSNFSLESLPEEQADFSLIEESQNSLSQKQQPDNLESPQVDTICMKANDIFCIGATIFCTFFGTYPFEEDARESDNIFSLVCNGKWSAFWELFNPRIEYLISTGFPSEKIAQLQDLIESTITYDSKNRIKIDQLMNHPFYQ